MVHHLRRYGLVSLILTGALACSDSATSETHDEWLEAYGVEGPFEQVVGFGKEDGAGRPGPQTAWDNDDYQVWKVSRSWNDVTDEAGLAWAANSGLTWDEKYAAWLTSLEKVQQPDNEYLQTFLLTTPQGRTLLAPVLECAEVAIFLRATFASWYNLPFFLEASDAGERLYLGHFGFRRADGRSFGRSPRFRTRYADYTSSWSEGQAWPVDEKLRRRGLYGGGDEVSFLPEIDGKSARAGAYFDEIFLNKRVGHFMLLALSWFGSIHLADGANMYHIRADHARSGDVLLLRWQRRGIGHTVPVMRVTKEADDRLEIAVATGSMPRRYPKWEEGASAARYFKKSDAGGPGENDDGEAFAKLGGGLRRWRVAEANNGRYSNTFAMGDEAAWINSTDTEAIADRIRQFGELLRELTPAERIALAEQLITAAREHLKKYPASCAARTRRENAFAMLYQANQDAFGLSQEDTDRDYRLLEDYVFAELTYNQSRTCCWNKSTRAMYDIIMEHAHNNTVDEASNQCLEPIVFKARGVLDSEDGYALYRSYAASLGRESEWVAWSEDEACPQSVNLGDDVEAEATSLPYCEITDTEPAGCGDTGPDFANAPMIVAGETTEFSLCAAETDRLQFVGDGNVIFAFEAYDPSVPLNVKYFDTAGQLLDEANTITDDAGRSIVEPASFRLSEVTTLHIEVTSPDASAATAYSVTAYVRD